MTTLNAELAKVDAAFLKEYFNRVGIRCYSIEDTVTKLLALPEPLWWTFFVYAGMAPETSND